MVQQRRSLHLPADRHEERSPQGWSCRPQRLLCRVSLIPGTTLKVLCTDTFGVASPLAPVLVSSDTPPSPPATGPPTRMTVSYSSTPPSPEEPPPTTTRETYVHSSLYLPSRSLTDLHPSPDSHSRSRSLGRSLPHLPGWMRCSRRLRR